MLLRVSIQCKGFVQGVGFRPFVYRIANNYEVSGFVRNMSWGVEIEVQGENEQVEQFTYDLQNKLPPLAEIQSLEQKVIPVCDIETGFRIIDSVESFAEASLISPDVATCPDCRREMNDPQDRRFHYPFINCTNCGPRFTIIEEVPYDRAKTTMRNFALCSECGNEYRNPADRRFHAEPVACPVCGPKIEFVGKAVKEKSKEAVGQDCPTSKINKNKNDDEDIYKTVNALKAGRIVAIKGLGGFHLACDATNEDAVIRLRARKNRPYKPLAVMIPDIETVRQYCETTEAEEKELQSYRQPILLLKKKIGLTKTKNSLAEALAPGLNEVGVMLPYTPLHHLIFSIGKFPALVMTSGNRSEEPIVIVNDDALSKLETIADDFLLHNRPIWNRCDDSVGYFREDRLVLTRRSRGFAPSPVLLSFDVPPMLAVGAQYCNVFTLADKRRAFLSQYIGDVDSLETLTFLKESIEKLERWLDIQPDIIVHDLHPDLLTTRFAQEIGRDKRLIAVQHHHAHFASALVANGISGPAIGVVFDGTGYGDDKTIWGGEFFVGDIGTVKRVGHLKPFPLPGGDAAIRKPVRTAIAILHALLPNKKLPKTILDSVSEDEITVVRQMVDKRFNTIPTSSIGRLFDAVSSTLGVRHEVTYEGQAAIELEHLASRANSAVSVIEKYDLHFSIEQAGDTLQISSTQFLSGLCDAIENNESNLELAFAFHFSLAEVTCKLVKEIAENYKLNNTVLCGGVFQNRLLTNLLASELKQHGIEPVLPGLIPVNDGGISLGQIAVASTRI